MEVNTARQSFLFAPNCKFKNAHHSTIVCKCGVIHLQYMSIYCHLAKIVPHAILVLSTQLHGPETVLTGSLVARRRAPAPAASTAAAISVPVAPVAAVAVPAAVAGVPAAVPAVAAVPTAVPAVATASASAYIARVPATAASTPAAAAEIVHASCSLHPPSAEAILLSNNISGQLTKK
jgi:hypothetical protein